MVTLRRTSSKSDSLKSVTFCPSMKICTESGFRNLSMRSSNHIQEQPPSAIKSFPDRLVNNFHTEQCDSFGYFAHAAFEPGAQLRRATRLPASTERFRPRCRVRKDNLRIALDTAVG